MLPEWLKALARQKNAKLGSVVEMTLNQNDGNSTIFESGTNSEEARKFKMSKC